jgi:hypothetical protein
MISGSKGREKALQTPPTYLEFDTRHIVEDYELKEWIS